MKTSFKCILALSPKVRRYIHGNSYTISLTSQFDRLQSKSQRTILLYVLSRVELSISLSDAMDIIIPVLFVF